MLQYHHRLYGVDFARIGRLVPDFKFQFFFVARIDVVEATPTTAHKTVHFLLWYSLFSAQTNTHTHRAAYAIINVDVRLLAKYDH